MNWKMAIYTILVLFYGNVAAQNYFRAYIESDSNCDELNNQVFNYNGTFYLVNSSSCNLLPPTSTIIQINSNGRILNEYPLHFWANYNSAHLNSNELFVVGQSNEQTKSLKFSLLNLASHLDTAGNIHLIDYDTTDIALLVPIGSIAFDSLRIVYGQFKLMNQDKYYSFLLWLNENFTQDTLMLVDDNYDWTLICDAGISEKGELVILLEAVKLVGHIQHRVRIINKYNLSGEKTFEWISPVFHIAYGLPSMALLDSDIVVLGLFSSDIEAVASSLIAIDSTGNTLWIYDFPSDDLFASYHIKDIVASQDGGIICAASYRNLPKSINLTGCVLKLNAYGHKEWERIYIDNEEINVSIENYVKVLLFNSLAETAELDIVVGGRIIHNYFEPNINSDVFLAIISPDGCINYYCKDEQDITSINEFLDSTIVWTEAEFYSTGYESRKFTFDSIPTLHNGRYYYKLLRTNSESSTNWVATGDLIRLENDKVFHVAGPVEYLLYDFSLMPGDTFYGDTPGLIVEKIDSFTLFNGELKKRWKLQPINPINPLIDNTMYWIEGIGNINGLFSNCKPWTFDVGPSFILCMYHNDNLIYKNQDYNDCWLHTTSIEKVPLEMLSIVPNPAYHKITIMGLLPEHTIDNVKLYTNLGVLILSDDGGDIPLEDVSAGYYYLVISIKNIGFKAIPFVKL